MPIVTVVLPTYNRANLVVEAIESVRAQTYQSCLAASRLTEAQAR